MLDLHRYTVNSSKRIVNNRSSRSKPHWCKSNKHYCNSAISKYLKEYDLKTHRNRKNVYFEYILILL